MAIWSFWSIPNIFFLYLLSFSLESTEQPIDRLLYNVSEAN